MSYSLIKHHSIWDHSSILIITHNRLLSCITCTHFQSRALSSSSSSLYNHSNSNPIPLLRFDDDAAEEGNNSKTNTVSPTPASASRRRRKSDNNNNNNNALSSSSSSVPRGFWKDKRNHRAFFDSVARDLGIQRFEDWYKITLEDLYSRSFAFRSNDSSLSISNISAQGLLKHYYGGSLVRALKAIYPEHANEWDPSRFARVPQGHWQDIRNHRKFFDRIAVELNIDNDNNKDAWYNVTVDDVKSRGGEALLRHYYDNSLLRALQAVYPEHPWKSPSSSSSPTTPSSSFDDDNKVDGNKRLPHGYWKDMDNQRRFFDKVARDMQLGDSLDAWYNVTAEDVIARGGRTLLADYYGGSLPRALAAVYPHHRWQVTRFKFVRVPNGYWDDLANQRRFFDRLASAGAAAAEEGGGLGIKTMDDWYRVTVDQVRAAGGGGLLYRYYGDSMARALMAIYPEHPWEPWRFAMKRGTRRSSNNNNSNNNSNSNSNSSRRRRGGGGGSSASSQQQQEQELEQGNATATATATVEKEKEENDGDDDDDGDDDNNNDGDDLLLLADYMEALARECHIQHLDDWYRVSEQQIRQFGGYGHYIRRNGGLFLVLKRLYPQHHWDEKLFQAQTTPKKAMQRQLLLAIKTRVFPGIDILENYLHPELKFANTSQPMELDIYLPSLSLALEYHGEQHYKDLPFLGGFASQSHRYQRHDDEKALACRALGITLVGIPYWWDGRVETLAATIGAARPDLDQALASLANGASPLLPRTTATTYNS